MGFEFAAQLGEDRVARITHLRIEANPPVGLRKARRTLGQRNGGPYDSMWPSISGDFP